MARVGRPTGQGQCGRKKREEGKKKEKKKKRKKIAASLREMAGMYWNVAKRRAERRAM
jgi:hypothetical protein